MKGGSVNIFILRKLLKLLLLPVASVLYEVGIGNFDEADRMGSGTAYLNSWSNYYLQHRYPSMGRSVSLFAHLRRYHGYLDGSGCSAGFLQLHA